MCAISHNRYGTFLNEKPDKAGGMVTLLLLDGEIIFKN
jgi:hypothetical protein